MSDDPEEKLDELLSQLPDRDALLILCDKLGTIISRMSIDSSDAQEGADFCSMLIHNACEECVYHGPPVSSTRH